MSARCTSQPWQPPSSHGRLGANQPSPRHTTTNQEHRMVVSTRGGHVRWWWDAVTVDGGHHRLVFCSRAVLKLLASFVRRKILFLPQLHLIPWKSRILRNSLWYFGRAGQTIKKSYAVHCITLIIEGDVFGRILILCVLYPRRILHRN